MATSPQRVDGLDIARALAIIGMMYAHTVYHGPSVLTDLSDGYPSTLFAVLSGITLAIIVDRHDWGVATIRGIALIAVSIVLTPFSGAIAVVLGTIGVAQILLAPLAQWSTRRLVILTGVLVLIGPLLQQALLMSMSPIGLIGDGAYPLPAWLAYTLLGVLLARVYWARALLWCIPAGAAAVLARSVLIDHNDSFLAPAGMADSPLSAALEFYLLPLPHSGSIVDMAATGLAAVAVIVALRYAHFYPLQAVGSMALTVYVTHVLLTAPLTAALNPTADGYSSAPVFGSSVFGTDDFGTDDTDTAPGSTRYEEGDSVADSAEAEVSQQRQRALDVLHMRLRGPLNSEQFERALSEYTLDYYMAEPDPLLDSTAPLSAEQEQLRDELLALDSPTAARESAERFIGEYSPDADGSVGEIPAPDAEPYSWQDVSVFSIQLLTALLGTSLYRLRWRRGPMEYLLHRLSIATSTSGGEPPSRSPSWVLRRRRPRAASATAKR
ncbi:DUF1624 domain-containing protein [Corynebacterium sp. TAE3-ERU2]|uniref:DUF1624 domain-containing protein n=1 Tax=Corynebacterium sp. TAE3-ERU2 TaxID=2849497 RepID=UPI001C442B33|nr:DUF1624 domain-containing protein [Corynebacterium sp. TAE3-ERU2]MBV7303086.1 DUF1624 domain-containing protein [Corynebacterium sp. TAE3-ERU2]